MYGSFSAHSLVIANHQNGLDTTKVSCLFLSVFIANDYDFLVLFFVHAIIIINWYMSEH